MRALGFTLLVLGCGSSTTTPATATDTGVADTAEASVDTGPVGTECTSARDTALGPQDKVSTGEVKIISDMGGVKTLFVDATAGGFSGAKNNPYTYVKFATGARVDITDKEAFTSLEWDLALKRASLHTNSGDAGLGKGGAGFKAGAAFDSLTPADESLAKPEKWFDAECQPSLDATGTIETSFKGWYSYEDTGMRVTPKPGVFVVKGAAGDLYKVEITSYYGTSTGGMGTASASYILKVAPLK